jgi:hypothetical protein
VNSRKPEIYQPRHPAPITIFRAKAPDVEGMDEPTPLVSIEWDHAADAWRVEYPGGGVFFLGVQ